MSEILVQVTDANFDETVKNSTKPVLLDFWAPWCGPCRMMEPVLEEVAAEWAGKIAVGKVNVDENPGTATKYDILSIPTLLVFSGGEVIKKLVGAMPKKRLAEELAPWIG
jgi:thioredoxin 1